MSEEKKQEEVKKRTTYGASIDCVNCKEEVTLRIKKGVSVIEFTKDLKCNNCGLPVRDLTDEEVIEKVAKDVAAQTDSLDTCSLDFNGLEVEITYGKDYSKVLKKDRMKLADKVLEKVREIIVDGGEKDE